MLQHRGAEPGSVRRGDRRPPRSCQLMRNRSAATAQQISTRPVSVLRLPCFAALVASSCSAMPSAWAASAAP